MKVTAREKSPAPFGADRIDAGRDRVGKFWFHGPPSLGSRATGWRNVGTGSCRGGRSRFHLIRIRYFVGKRMITVKEFIGPKFDAVMDHAAAWSKQNLDNLMSIESTTIQDDRQDFIVAACTVFGRADPFLTCFLGQVMLTYASFILDKNTTIDIVMSQNECLSRILLLARAMKFISGKDMETFDLVITGLNVFLHKKTFGIQSAMKNIDSGLLDKSIVAVESFLGEMIRTQKEDQERRSKDA